MADPGLSLKHTTIEEAWRLATGRRAEVPAPLEEAADAVEAMALGAGLRSRRVILDARWWTQAGGVMVARVEERRRAPRGETPAVFNAFAAAGTGWVALVPRLGGYLMRALDDEGRVAQWRVDEAVAS